jgi:coproporphyrinogen III oxidase-like Fe-S oxidoreductase
VEELPAETRELERAMLGLRLDEPLVFEAVEQTIDLRALGRLERLGLAERRGTGIALTPRGRFLGDAVTAELLA